MSDIRAMSNRLSGRFTVPDLCTFSWPTIVSLVFISMYSMVDGAFVARLVGTDALSAVNLFFPVACVYFAVGIMLATGASAIVARQMGEGRPGEARANFSFVVVVALAVGVIQAALALTFLDPLLRLLGAEGGLLLLCREYALPLLPFVPAAIIQVLLQSFFIAAGRPGFGLAITLSGGLLNIVLDYVFIALFGWGLSGAALATGIGYSLPAVLGLAYFLFKRTGSLYLVRPRVDWRLLVDSCVNGSSEMVTNLSAAVVIYLFNMSMLRYLGVDGVAAVTIVLYAEFLLSSINYGYSSGVAPLFSYQYGKSDGGKLKKLFRNSVLLVGGCSAAALAIAQTFAGHIVSVFASADGTVYHYALHGYRIYSLCFLFMGFNIFASALFTALSNGKISALLSFLRFVFIAGAILVLPRFVGVDGIWMAVPLAEVVAVAVSAYCVYRYRGMYRYA